MAPLIPDEQPSTTFGNANFGKPRLGGVAFHRCTRTLYFTRVSLDSGARVFSRASLAAYLIRARKVNEVNLRSSSQFLLKEHGLHAPGPNALSRALCFLISGEYSWSTELARRRDLSLRPRVTIYKGGCGRSDRTLEIGKKNFLMEGNFVIFRVVSTLRKFPIDGKLQPSIIAAVKLTPLLALTKRDLCRKTRWFCQSIARWSIDNDAIDHNCLSSILSKNVHIFNGRMYKSDFDRNNTSFQQHRFQKKKWGETCVIGFTDQNLILDFTLQFEFKYYKYFFANLHFFVRNIHKRKETFKH